MLPFASKVEFLKAEADQDKQHDHTLQNIHQRHRYAACHLHLFRAGIQTRQHHRRCDDPRRIQTADQCHHHAGNAHAFADALDQAVLNAKDLYRAGKSGKRARHHHGDEPVELYVASGIFCRLGAFAHDAQIIAKAGILAHEPV